MSINFRHARPADLPAIMEIFNESADLPVNDEVELVTPDSRQSWFSSFNDRFPIWVAENASGVIAWCALEPFYHHPAYRFSAEISLYVSQSVQRQGIGKQFLDFVDHQVRNNLTIKTIIAYIYQGNLPSQSLFIKAGYQKWGQLKQVAVLKQRAYSLLIFGKTY